MSLSWLFISVIGETPWAERAPQGRASNPSRQGNACSPEPLFCFCRPIRAAAPRAVVQGRSHIRCAGEGRGRNPVALELERHAELINGVEQRCRALDVEPDATWLSQRRSCTCWTRALVFHHCGNS